MQTGRIAILFLVGLASTGSAFAQFAGGDGSATNAYRIATPTQFNNIRNYKGSLPDTFVYFQQTADLDLSGYPNWVPIGTNSAAPACVHYDGDGYKISNLNISRPSESYVGLFGHLRGSVRNLSIVSGSVIGNFNVGAIAGTLLDASISNCVSMASVSGTYAGGLVGLSQNSTLRHVSVRGTTISGSSGIGGLVGFASGGTLAESYAAASVMGSSDTGGLIGYASATPSISRCYWDTTVSGQATSAGGGSGRSTTQMQQRGSFSDWDFANTWQLYHGKSYPYLRALASTVSDPVLLPGDGEYPGSSVTVTATCATAGATIHYATGFGQTPTDQTTNTVESGATIEVLIFQTLNAVAWVPYMNPSDVVSATYDPATAVATPTASPKTGSYAGTNVMVTISCVTSNAEIRYTLNGIDPDETSTPVPPSGAVNVPLNASTGTTLKAKAWLDGLNPSDVMEEYYEPMPTVATPEFDPDGGSFTGSTVSVTITCTTPGAMIHYTTNSSVPTTTNAWVSSGSTVVVPLGTTLKARAWADGMVESLTKSAVYSSAGTVAMPTVDPDGGDVAAGFVTVTVRCATAGATIRYTTDGLDPDALSPIVANGQSVSVPVPGTLKAKAWASGLNASPIKRANYMTADVVATPTFSPAGGTATVGVVNVTLSCLTPGAQIHYTTNNVPPSESDPFVADGGVVSISLPATLMAKAFKDGLFPSPVNTAFYGPFAGGTGTAQDPYRIANAYHLNNVRDHLDAQFVLIDDIDLDVSPWNTGAGWELIGDLYGAFTGTMDGQGHVVSNLFVDRPSDNAVGLFGYVESGGRIHNLGLSGGSVRGGQYVGALVGYNYGIVSNCYSSVAAAGNTHVGGLIGFSSTSSRCQDSYAMGSITAIGSSPSFLGGLVGTLLQATVTRCYAAGNVQSIATAGGLIGGANSSTVSDSYWDVDTCGQSSSAGGSGRTTAQMYLESSYSGWDFGSIWSLQEEGDYPHLQVFDPPSLLAPPDAWLVRFYGSVAAAPEFSVKGDPLYWEYVAGSDPTDPQSRFAVTTATLATNTVSLSLNSATGRVYRLLSRGSLLTGEWQSVGGVAEQAGTGAPLEFSLPAPSGPVFYRIGVSLSE